MIVSPDESERERRIAALLIGRAPALAHLRRVIARVASTSIPVLIQGPSGAGKELVARALHVASGRTGSFVPFNVCAITDTMFEDALFGHVRGAFTGAASDSPGYLAEANGGTLFLDEISGLPLASQAKLLRAIETREYRPVGGRLDRRSDFRVVAATNDDMRALVRARAFRDDLAHRIAGLVLDVPPLHRRAEDVALLVEHFLQQDAVSLHRRITFRTSALRVLADYDWPGNVRELRNVVHTAAALAVGDAVTADDIRPLLRHDAADRAAAMRGEQEDARRALIQTLAQHRWDVAAAADSLGVHRVTLYRRMRRLGIPPNARASMVRSHEGAPTGSSASPPDDAPRSVAVARAMRTFAQQEH